MKIHKISFNFLTAAVSFSLMLPNFFVAEVEAAPRPIIFPVIGPATFVNDYYVPRPNGIHAATDIMAKKGQKLVAATHGIITYVGYPQPKWGYEVEITDSQGYTYIYLHMNDDTPGTNDGSGGPMNAYGPDIKVGNRVEAGQFIGWNGDSGHSNGVAHLHFEIIDPNNQPINPYESLRAAPRIQSPTLYPPLSGETLPYWVESDSGLNLAMGDFNGDEKSETVAAASRGGSPLLKTYTGDNQFLGRFYAYDPDFRGGVDVATGDLTGDGIDEIITGPGPGGGPWVRVFDTQAQLLSQFAAYDPAFKGGIKVAAGDVNGDGIDEIITGPGPGGGPWVRVFDTQAQLLSQFAAYDPGFIGGIDVTAGDTEGTDANEIMVSPGPGGGPWVRVFDAVAKNIVDIQVYDAAYRGGVRVSAGNVKPDSPKDEIMTIPLELGEPRVRLMSNTGANITDYPYLESWWQGHYDVAAGNGDSKLGTGVNRRSSMRDGPR
jgi:hypothetical protein